MVTPVVEINRMGRCHATVAHELSRTALALEVEQEPVAEQHPEQQDFFVKKVMEQTVEYSVAA